LPEGDGEFAYVTNHKATAELLQIGAPRAQRVSISQAQ
jgi:hypothetical protein